MEQTKLILIFPSICEQLLLDYTQIMNSTDFSVVSVNRIREGDEDYQEGYSNSWVVVDKPMLHNVFGGFAIDDTPVFVPLPNTMWKGSREVNLTDEIIDTLAGKIALNMLKNPDAIKARRAKLVDYFPPQDELEEIMKTL